MHGVLSETIPLICNCHQNHYNVAV